MTTLWYVQLASPRSALPQAGTQPWSAALERYSAIASAIRAMHRAGFDVDWSRPARASERHVFSAHDLYGETRIVTGQDALAALTELCDQCGYDHTC